jgi:DNA repair exonuclease SbcCD ATPase subunit
LSDALDELSARRIECADKDREYAALVIRSFADKINPTNAQLSKAIHHWVRCNDLARYEDLYQDHQKLMSETEVLRELVSEAEEEMKAMEESENKCRRDMENMENQAMEAAEATEEVITLLNTLRQELQERDEEDDTVIAALTADQEKHLAQIEELNKIKEEQSIELEAATLRTSEMAVNLEELTREVDRLKLATELEEKKHQQNLEHLTKELTSTKDKLELALMVSGCFTFEGLIKPTPCISYFVIFIFVHIFLRLKPITQQQLCA